MSSEPTVDADPAYDQARFTPMQALYHLLSQTGYVQSKLEFARLLKINAGNIYAYLADPTPRGDNEIDTQQGKNRSRISPRAETLHGWCWALKDVTGLAIDIHLLYNGNLTLRVSGTDSQQRVIRPISYRTIYRLYDFPEPFAWLTESTAKRMYAALVTQRACAVKSEEETETPGRSKAAMTREQKKIDKQIERIRDRLVQLIGEPAMVSLETEQDLLAAPSAPPATGTYAEA